MALPLTSDINLNPGPVTRHESKDPKFEAFNNKGLHLIYLNINNLLPKIDELCSNAAVIGIAETKVDNIVYDSEITIDGYSIVRNDTNRKRGGCIVILGATFANQGKHVYLTT